MACVVVLEDEPEVRIFLRDVLRYEGHDVVCLSHPSQIESMLLVTNPDLFMIDLTLTGTDGSEIARNLRNGICAQVPMIAISDSVMRSHVAERSGVFDGALRRPFDADEVLDVINRHLAHVGV